MAFSLTLLYSNVRPLPAGAADETVSKETHLTYHCAVEKPIPTDFDMPVTIKGTVPTVVEPGEEVTINNSQTTVTIPKDQVGTMHLLGNSLSGETTKFEIQSFNTDKTVNVADQAKLVIPETTIDPTNDLKLTVPDPAISVTGFKAGEEGTLTLRAGEIDTVLVIHGPKDVPVEASCVPKDEDTTIAKITIQEKAVDNPPEITLNGDNPMKVEVGDAWKDPGATASDDVDGDLTAQIKVSGDKVDPDKLGTYKVTYSVTDSAGHTTTVDRTVNVVKPEGSILYSCNVTQPIPLTFTMPVIVKGKAPETVKPGAAIKITESQSIVKIPSSTVDVMRLLHATSVTGTTDEFLLHATNKDATVDVAKQQGGAIQIPETPVPTEGPITLTVPDQGMEVTGFTAGDEGVLTIKAGEIKTTMKLNGVPDILSTTVAVCNPMDGEDTTANTIKIDGEAPVITLNGENPMTVDYGSTFNDPGAKANDNLDGDISDQIVVTGEVDTHKVGSYTLTYTVSDRAGNTATAERTVKVVDNEKPVITLNGDNPMTVEMGSTFEDPGATATDNVDGDLTSQIQVTGSVDTSQFGTYTLTYSVTDSAGNTATATRTVNVVKSKGTITPGEETVVYPGEQVTIDGTNIVLTMPEDLPLGTTLTVTDVSNSDAVSKAEGLELAGHVYQFDFTYPNGQAPKGTFTLTMGYDTGKYSSDQVDIYYFNEETGKWEAQHGTVDGDAGTITIQPSHFSTYGVFAKVDNSGDNDGGDNGGNGGDNGDNGGGDNGNNNGDQGNGGNTGNDTGSGNNSNNNSGNNNGDNSQGGKLPNTAAYNPIGIACGFIMAVIGAMFVFRKKKTAE